MPKANNISGVFILNHWKREKEGKVQLKLVGRDCKKLGIETQLSFDDGSLSSILKNLCQALRMPVQNNSKGWRLIVHDDLLVPTSSIEKLNYILGFMPEDAIVSAYCPSNNGYDVAFEKGNHIMKTSSNIWGQAVAYPEMLIPEVLEFMGTKVVPDYKYDDRALATFLKLTKKKCCCIIPSLFQHLGSYRSTLGIAGKVGGRYRYSEHFEPNFNPHDVDWEHELANPATGEVNFSMEGVLI